MSVTARWYPHAARQMFLGNLNGTTSVYKIALLNGSGTYTAADTDWADVSGDEIAATGGYTAGGETTTLTVTSDGTASYFETSAVTWTAATFTFRHAVVYDDTSNKLLFHLTFIADQSPNNQEYRLNAPSPKMTATPA